MRNKYRNRNRRTVLKAVGSLGVLSVAGCLNEASSDSDGGNDDEAGNYHHDSDHDSLPDEPAGHADVAMLTADDGHHFDPHLVWIENGATVTWTNESGSHTATAYHPEFDKPLRIPEETEPWDSGMYSDEGATFEHTFDVDGVYDYFCIPHEYRAMIGTVIVGDPDPHEQPALEPPQDDLPDEARDLLQKLNTQTNEALGHTHD